MKQCSVCNSHVGLKTMVEVDNMLSQSHITPPRCTKTTEQYHWTMIDVFQAQGLLRLYKPVLALTPMPVYCMECFLKLLESRVEHARKEGCKND